MFNLITFAVYHNAPGKEQMVINICYGKMPVQYMNTDNPKPMLHIIIVDSLSIALHFGFWVTKQALKLSFSQKFKDYKTFEMQLGSLIKRDNINTFAVNISCLVLTVITVFYLPRRINRMHPVELQTYPNYYLIYFQDLVMNPCCLLAIMMLYLARNKKLRVDVWQDMKQNYLNS